jgi:hypothetical protein
MLILFQQLLCFHAVQELYAKLYAQFLISTLVASTEAMQPGRPKLWMVEKKRSVEKEFG